MWSKRTYRSVGWLCAAGVIVSGCCPPVEILPESLPNAAEGTAYSQGLSSGAPEPQAWSVTAGALPAGVGIDSSAGVISGTPAEAGTFEFTAAVLAGLSPGCPGERSYSLTVIPRLRADTSLSQARVGEAYTHSFAISGGVAPYQAILVGLPGGLGFSSATATLSGTPNVARTDIQLQLTVTDSGDPQQSLVESMLLTVKPLRVQITTAALTSGQVNVPYSDQVVAENGSTPFSWAVVAGVLPSGLRLNLNTGAISGTPTVAGTGTFTIQVTDSDSLPTSDSQQFTLVIEE